MKNQFKGFELFNDIEDAELRSRNRAVVLANIATDHTRKKLISPKGAGLILSYFMEIPEGERAPVKEKFAVNMKERGYVFTS